MQEGELFVWGGFTKLRKEERIEAKEKGKDIPVWVQSSKEQQDEVRKASSVMSEKK